MALLREEVRVDFPPKPSVSQLTFLSSYPLFLVTAQESLRQGGWGLRLGRPDCDTEGLPNLPLRSVPRGEDACPASSCPGGREAYRR